MSEVNRLRREERELGLQAQELEIEDNLARHETISVNGNYKHKYIYCMYLILFNFYKYKTIFSIFYLKKIF